MDEDDFEEDPDSMIQLTSMVAYFGNKKESLDMLKEFE